MNSGRGCRDVKPVSNVNARDQISNREREGTGDKEKEERERERRGGGGWKALVQGFLVYGTPGRQGRCFLSAREPLSNESLTGYAFVKAMNWKFSHLRFKVDAGRDGLGRVLVAITKNCPEMMLEGKRFGSIDRSLEYRKT